MPSKASGPGSKTFCKPLPTCRFRARCFWNNFRCGILISQAFSRSNASLFADSIALSFRLTLNPTTQTRRLESWGYPGGTPVCEPSAGPTLINRSASFPHSHRAALPELCCKAHISALGLRQQFLRRPAVLLVELNHVEDTGQPGGSPPCCRHLHRWSKSVSWSTGQSVALLAELDATMPCIKTFSLTITLQSVYHLLRSQQIFSSALRRFVDCLPQWLWKN